jgi:hypothetical protein
MTCGVSEGSAVSVAVGGSGVAEGGSVGVGVLVMVGVRVGKN